MFSDHSFTTIIFSVFELLMLGLDGLPMYSRKTYTWEELRIPVNGVQGLGKVVYPKEVCYTKGDLPLKNWANNPAIMDADIEFAVERIVDERIYRGKKQYLVKWKVWIPIAFEIATFFI